MTTGPPESEAQTCALIAADIHAQPDTTANRINAHRDPAQLLGNDPALKAAESAEPTCASLGVCSSEYP